MSDNELLLLKNNLQDRIVLHSLPATTERRSASALGLPGNCRKHLGKGSLGKKENIPISGLASASQPPCPDLLALRLGRRIGDPPSPPGRSAQRVRREQSWRQVGDCSGSRHGGPGRYSAATAGGSQPVTALSRPPHLPNEPWAPALPAAKLPGRGVEPVKRHPA